MPDKPKTSVYEILLNEGEELFKTLHEAKEAEQYVFQLTGGDKPKPRLNQPTTPHNIMVAIQRQRLHPRFNMLSKRYELQIRMAEGSAGDIEAHARLLRELNLEGKAWHLDELWLSTIRERLIREASISASEKTIEEVVLQLAQQDCYNPITEWVRAVEWDGVSRLQNYYDTIKLKKDYHHPHMKEVYMFKGLVQMIQAWTDNVEGVPLPVGHCLVLIGRSGVGKTEWIKRHLPEVWVKISAQLHMGGNSMLQASESAAKIAGYGIAELGEIESIWQTSEHSAIKQFMMNTYDEGRLPFQRTKFNYPRTTVLMGSVEQKSFLAHDDGSRRFWVLECEEIDYHHDIDMQQLFAEVMVLKKAGADYFLSVEEELQHRTHITQYHNMDAAVEELIIQLENAEYGVPAIPRTITQIYELVGARMTKSKKLVRAYLEKNHSDAYHISLYKDGERIGSRVWLLPLASEPVNTSRAHFERLGLCVVETRNELGADDSTCLEKTDTEEINKTSRVEPFWRRPNFIEDKD